MRPGRSLPSCSLLLCALAGCLGGSTSEVWVPPLDEGLSAAVPLPGRHLDRASPVNHGTLAFLAADGTPRRDGGDIDPLLIETRRFYDTLQWPGAEPRAVDYPNPFTGAMEPERRTAPLSLDEWKHAFSFPRREGGERLADYRKRAGIVVYYNKNELGLGRELGCSEFDDGVDSGGRTRRGLACFVTNYGAVFGDQERALVMAVAGDRPRNTVCISYRPSLGAAYEVQFYTYDADGNRQEYAQLDSLGARPHPQVCINCHGGSYDSSRHLARNARFLPLDPNVVVFPEGDDGPTRASQEEPIRRINAAALVTPLTPAQREMVDGLYDGQPRTAGRASAVTWSPAAWQTSRADHDLYDQVLKPYCATCHMAIHEGDGDRQLTSYTLFASRADLRRFPLPGVLCNSFSMPNAQPTMMHFWDTRRAPLAIGDQSFPSAADALLAAFGSDRTGCSGLGQAARCDLAPDPDARCGDAQSGLACNRQTGRCVPEMADPARGADGFCRLDGSRSCPRTFTCQRAISIEPGLESFDGICLPESG
jgi:hypothetical protein